MTTPSKSSLLLCLLLGIYASLFSQNKMQLPMEDLPPVSLEAAGLNPDSVQRLLDLIDQQTRYDFRSFILIKDQKMVLEEYRNSFWRETIHDIRSAGKSVTALLMGIAIDQGLVESAEARVYDFFPEITPPTKAHRDIRIKHLLHMSSGLDADTDDSDTPGNSYNWIAQDDWITPVLNLSMTFEPDSRWVYNDACAMLCAAIIEKTSGKSLSDFAREHLFTPLGEREFYWFQNASGTTGGMGNLYISNLTFAKLGLLVLNKGKYQGKQIISSSWIEQCMTPALDLNDDWPEGTQYGFFWYLYPVQENGKTYQCAYATGNGGNKVFVLPELNMVLAVQSSAYGQGYGHGRAWYILYALLRALK